MAVKLWPTQPKDFEVNGLGALERPLVEDPIGPYFIVAEVNRRRATIDDDADETVPTIRLVHAEALFGDLAVAARELLRKAQEGRVGPRVRVRPAPTLFDGNGPGDENPDDEPGDPNPDPDGQGPADGDLEPAAGSPPFLAAVTDVTDDDTDGE